MVKQKERIVCIFAHPDDESFAVGGSIAKWVDEGKEIHLICMTDGKDVTNDNHKGKDLRKIRKKELEKASEILGIKKIHQLNFNDGELRNNIYDNVEEEVEKILVKVKPTTLVTFEPRGVSGHLDHMFCSSVTSYLFHKLSFVKKVYYVCLLKKHTNQRDKDYFVFFPDGYAKEEIDYIENIEKYRDKKKKAILSHKTQVKPDSDTLKRIEKRKNEYFLVREK